MLPLCVQHRSSPFLPHIFVDPGESDPVGQLFTHAQYYQQPLMNDLNVWYCIFTHAMACINSCLCWPIPIPTSPNNGQPAPLSETVDHTADSSKSSEVLAPDTSFSSVSTSTNPLSTNPLSTNPPSSTPSSDSEDENEEDDATHRTRKWEWAAWSLIHQHWLIHPSGRVAIDLSVVASPCDHRTQWPECKGHHHISLTLFIELKMHPVP